MLTRKVMKNLKSLTARAFQLSRNRKAQVNNENNHTCCADVLVCENVPNYCFTLNKR